MGKKRNYESPSIRRTQVETESGFCAASILQEPNDKGINTQGHEVGTVIDASKGSEWDNNAWQ